MTNVALILKAPHPGEVKTRLVSSIGAERATRVYRALVEHQLQQIPASWHIAIHFTPSNAEAEMRTWLGSLSPGETDFIAQPEGDLGVRLISAMDRGFASGADLVFFLGGDCPGTTGSYLEEAEATLAGTDMVIARALDGGYVLLGMRKPTAALFEEIPWSSDAVFDATIRQARASGLSYQCLSPLEDIDDLESYQRQRTTIQDLVRASFVL